MSVPAEVTFVAVTSPDPAWAPAIRARRAMLWLTPRAASGSNGEAVKATLRRVIQHPWAAVFVDAGGIPVEELRGEELKAGELPLRIYTEFPATPPPPNRVPVYVLPGARTASATDATNARMAPSPRDTLNRLQMLQRGAPEADLFVVGVLGPEDLGGIAEALGISDAFRRCIFVTHKFEGAATLEGTERVTHWSASFDEFLAFLDAADSLAENAERFLVRVQGRAGPVTIDLHGCVDHSAPITAAFELLPVASVIDDRPATLEDVQEFFADPTASWRPYASGVPHVRHEPHRRELFDLLGRFRRDGASATLTAWLTADDGSGATTTLRHLAFEIAQAGYPVLVARPEAERLDFHQLAAFLTRSGERFAAADIASTETPWVIAFDVQHLQRHWDFVTGVAAGLRKLQRPALVLAVSPSHGREDDTRRDALGTNRVLAPALSSLLTPDDAVALGLHLNRQLPPSFHRSRQEWTRFLEDTLRSTADGTRSLFWVALRFWLLRVPGTEESLRSWLAKRVAAILHPEPPIHAAVLETAALAKYRLTVPRDVLPSEVIPSMRVIATDPANPIGLAIVHGNHASAFTISHPLLADELLRLAAADDYALAAVGKSACIGPFDLELHLLERVLTRPTVGGPEGVELVEALVTSALRVDPREAPRNFNERERIVGMLEQVPDSVWDASQIFNHHVAKARRHLATDPPSTAWGEDAIREQFVLAESHLLDAIENIVPEDQQRRESPLNLRVSLALTYDARAKYEFRSSAYVEAERFRQQAERAYRMAQRLDADNSYVLENYARFKLYQASKFAAGEERIRLIVDAIALLEWERRMDETGRREEPILLDLANGYEALERDNGRILLRELASAGSESAIVALALLALRGAEPEESTGDHDGNSGRSDEGAANQSSIAPKPRGGADAWEAESDPLEEAEALLRAIPAANATARSTFLLYQVVSRRRPLAFAERLDLLSQLDGDQEFAWPLQARFEFGILLFQVGQANERRHGQEIFRQIREELSSRSASLRLPAELRFLADPRKGFSERLRTSITVRKTNDTGRNYFGVPYGWGTVEIPFRAHDFGPNLRPRDERDCFIRFTNFGPQAVPTTTE